MLLKHIDFCGIDRVVIFPPFACQMDDDIVASNQWGLERGEIAFRHHALDESGRPRVYGGVTSVLSLKNPDNLFWYLGAEKILDVATLAGVEKLIYGLDFPWNSKEINKEDIDLIQSLDLDDKAKANILGGSLTKLIS